MPGRDPKPTPIIKASKTAEEDKVHAEQSMSVRDSLQAYSDNQLQFFAKLLLDFLKEKNSHDKWRMRKLNDIETDLGKDKEEVIEDIMNLVAFSNRFYSDPLITPEEKMAFYNRLEELKTHYLSGNIHLFPEPSLELPSQNTSSLSANQILELTKEVYRLLVGFSKEHPSAPPQRKRDICFEALELLAITVQTAITERNPGKLELERMIQRLQTIISTFRERTRWRKGGEEKLLNQLTRIEERYSLNLAKPEGSLQAPPPESEHPSNKRVHLQVEQRYHEKRNEQSEKRNSTFLYRPAKARETQIKDIEEILAGTEDREGKVNALNQIKANIQAEVNWLDSALEKVIDELIQELEEGHTNTPSNMSPH